jgi:hypothetical protein
MDDAAVRGIGLIFLVTVLTSKIERRTILVGIG